MGKAEHYRDSDSTLSRNNSTPATVLTRRHSLGLLFLGALTLGSMFSASRTEAQESVVDSSATLSSIVEVPEAPQPALNVSAQDLKNDGGGSIQVSWEVSQSLEGGGINGYRVLRGTAPSGPFDTVGNTTPEASKFTDNGTTDGVEYYYRVDAFVNYLDAAGAKAEISTPSVAFGAIKSSAQWFNLDRFICLILVLFVAGSIIYFIMQAKSGRELYIRKIAGVDAVDEAVGRATEMGKKIFFVPGIQDMNDVQTIAGIAILGRVAQVAAEYETWLEVPVSKSLVMVTARETMKEAYAKIGRPDAYQDAQVHYVTDDQFGYAAALDGMFTREKPATIFYMGAFFAESLILAETGNEAGAIQIAGTAMPSQLPFFVAACDYTLIGEELFAASAYLSREPRQLGSLKGQDVGKSLFLILILIGLLVETMGWFNLSDYIQVR